MQDPAHANQAQSVFRERPEPAPSIRGTRHKDRPPPHGCPSTKYIKPTHRALSYLLLLQMIPERKFLQRQGEIFPPNLFTFQISVAITTQHNYLCEAFSFQVLPSTTLCGEFNSALSITTHFFNQFGSGIFFSINTHKICCAKLLKANRETPHLADPFLCQCSPQILSEAGG